jgi:hypothetical protein
MQQLDGAERTRDDPNKINLPKGSSFGTKFLIMEGA